jgi:hypothetical protein
LVSCTKNSQTSLGEFIRVYASLSESLPRFDSHISRGSRSIPPVPRALSVRSWPFSPSSSKGAGPACSVLFVCFCSILVSFFVRPIRLGCFVFVVVHFDLFDQKRTASVVSACPPCAHRMARAPKYSPILRRFSTKTFSISQFPLLKGNLCVLK